MLPADNAIATTTYTDMNCASVQRKGSWGQQPELSRRGGHPLTTCGDIREIYGECLESHSQAQICKKAASYFTLCASSALE